MPLTTAKKTPKPPYRIFPTSGESLYMKMKGDSRIENSGGDVSVVYGINSTVVLLVYDGKNVN